MTACGSQLERPADPVFPEHAAFSIDYPTGGSETVHGGHWWQNLTAPALQDALAAALAANPEIRVAAFDVDAAQARLRQARAAAGPRVEARAQADLQRSSGDTDNTRSMGIDANLPIDLNQALALRRNAALFDLQQTREALAQARSDTARDFFVGAIDAREAGLLLALLDEQTEVAETLLRLIELRFTQGLASSVDVLQQRDQLAALREQIPNTRYELRQAHNRLRRLGARTPEQATDIGADDLPTVRDAFAVVDPMHLLHRRPELRAARAELRAEDARFAAALADRWPSLDLSGSALTRAVSGDVTTIFAAAIDAALTLFDGGAKQAVAAERRALLRRAGEAYLSKWFDIVLDVDDRLHEHARLRERILLSLGRLETARALLDAARRRYERGISDYLPVLEALRGLQQQQRDHLALQAALARVLVYLHHAFGDAGQGEAS